MRVFIDTSAFIALLIAQDDDHQIVTETLSSLVTKRATLYTSEYVLDELYTRINYDLGTLALSKALKYIQQAGKDGSLNILEVAGGVLERAPKMMLKYSALKLSCTDCVSFLLVRELKLHCILTLDSDFVKLGLEVLPHAERRR